MIVAMFNDEPNLARALQRLRGERVGPLETLTPAPLQGESEGSPIPVIILLAGLLGAAASFGLQTWSAVVAYPFRSGGHPDFAWASFIPTTFENAVLVAIVTGFAAFMIINRLPRLYDPIDELPAIREASRDGWFLAVRTEDAATLDHARALLRDLHPARLDELPG